MVIVVLGLITFFYGYGNDTFVWMLFGIAVAVGGGVLGIKGKRHALKDADELLANNKRPPVLYLRSFGDEVRENRFINVFSALFSRAIAGTGLGMRNQEQEKLSGIMNRVGPYITVARPGEYLPDVGAAWKRIPGNRWKSEVGKLIKLSRLIVVHAGYSDGLRWEFEQLAKHVDPKKILLIVPRKRRDYDQFRDWAAAVLPKPLPPKIPPSLLVIFDKSWQPKPLKAGSDLFENLFPFFKQNNINSPPNATQAGIQDKKARKGQDAMNKRKNGVKA